MNVTETYSLTHDAFQMATPEGATPFDVRVLVAISENGGAARTDELEMLLITDGSAVRRSAGTLYALGLAKGLAVDGKCVRRGMRSVLALTDKGEAVVRLALSQVGVEAIAA